MEQETSTTYRVLKKAGLNLSEGEYGRIGPWSAFKRAFRSFRNSILLKYCMYSVLFAPLNYRLLRPKLWRIMGCKVGKNVFIGYEVEMDISHAALIEIGDGVHITNRCLILCHQRDSKDYYRGDDSSKLPYKKEKVVLKRGCMLGMGTIVLPGVTVGEGSLIAAGSVVTRDIPAWTVAAGNPARVIREIKERELSA